MRRLISGAQRVRQGEYGHRFPVERDDEIGQLAQSINEIAEEIGQKQSDLDYQREAFRNLFELAPCYITVQDRDFKLLRFNREFETTFAPKPGEYCFEAYKGRSERCEICPLVATFEDGNMHTSEEAGINKDGTQSFCMVRTSPVMNSEGEVVAAMEICLDVTRMRFLEDEVRKSEEKYRTIFNSIPNPVFVLDNETLDILDCNDRVRTVYGFGKEELLMKSFSSLFEESEREDLSEEMRTSRNLNQARHVRKDGQIIYVNIHSSSLEYDKREVFLVTTSDITAKLMAERQLIQASKMATLGQMATGVAHELNQPLSVIKTASTFLMKKIKSKEAIREDIIETLAAEMDSHVDRASKIINHMREFGRQSDTNREEVAVNQALEKALEIFSQQLRLRGIEVVKEMEEDLPLIMGDANRLEQVFINLLTNARDAIEEKWAQSSAQTGTKQIHIKTHSEDGLVVIEVKDSGTGIPKAIIEKIFDPFFTTKKAGMGTGLGLSISYGIVRDFNGNIRVESPTGEGSNFIMQFPIAGGERCLRKSS